MNTNPFYNALLASLYIVLLVVGVNLGSRLPGAEAEANLLMPMGMLSIFVLSVATMGYLFFYHPVTLLLDGKRAEAVQFFLRTIGTFAVVTFTILFIGLFFF